VVTDLRIGKEAAQEAAIIDGIRPSGSHVIGWVDFNAEKGGDQRVRRFALLMTRSGKALAVRGSDVRAIPPALFPHIRLSVGS